MNGHKECPRCHGEGSVPDPVEVGAMMRDTRKGYGLSLSEVARRIGITAPFLADVEAGRRSFSPENVAKWKEAVK